MANRGEEMLTVVKEKEHLRGPEMRDDVSREVAICTGLQAKQRGKGCRQDCGITDRREVHEDHAAGKCGACLRCDHQRQMGLAGAPWPGQRQEGNAVVQQPRARQLALGFAAEQARARQRE